MTPEQFNGFYDALPAVLEWTPETAAAARAVLTTAGVQTLLGLVKSEINGKMVSLSSGSFYGEAGIANLARIQGEIAGLRRILDIVAESLVAEKEDQTQ